MNEALKRDLAQPIGARAVIDAPDRCNAFAGDWSGLKPQQPSLVLRPGSARDAAAAVQLLYRVGVPMTFRGTGTGKAGGCIPSKALLESSHLYEEASHGMSEHGVQINGVELIPIGQSNFDYCRLTMGLRNWNMLHFEGIRS